MVVPGGPIGETGLARGFGGRDRLEIGQIAGVPAAFGNGDTSALYQASGSASSSSSGGGDGRAEGRIADGGALRRLLWEIEKRTSIEVQPEAVAVRLGDEAELYRHPLLYWSGDRAFVMPSEDDLARLRRHLVMGGMLILDSAEGRAGGGFDGAARALVSKLFPSQPLGRLPEDHVLYRSFYLLRIPAGRVIAQPYLEAVLLGGGRAAIVYTQNDLGGAWARDRFGQWQHEVVPGGDSQREQAFRLGVNLVMYAFCLDYKSDQVHVPFIMRRRMWQAPLPQYKINPDSPQPGTSPQ